MKEPESKLEAEKGGPGQGWEETTNAEYPDNYLELYFMEKLSLSPVQYNAIKDTSVKEFLGSDLKDYVALDSVKKQVDSTLKTFLLPDGGVDEVGNKSIEEYLQEKQKDIESADK